MRGGRFMLGTVFRKQTNLAKLTHREPGEESWVSFIATCRNCAWSVAVVFCSVLVWEMSRKVLIFSGPSFFKRKMNRLMWSSRCLSVCLSILTYFTKIVRNCMIQEAILWYWRPFCDTGGHFYDTEGYFTAIISRSPHSEMAIYLTWEFLWRNWRYHCLFRVLIMINVGRTKHSESI